MANFIITNQIEDPAKLIDFSSEGYTLLSNSLSLQPVFLRAEANARPRKLFLLAGYFLQVF